MTETPTPDEADKYFKIHADVTYAMKQDFYSQLLFALDQNHKEN